MKKVFLWSLIVSIIATFTLASCKTEVVESHGDYKFEVGPNETLIPLFDKEVFKEGSIYIEGSPGEPLNFGILE